MPGKSPGRMGYSWLNAGWLAREIVVTDRYITLARDRRGGHLVAALEEYRQVIRETRSALMRGLAVPSMRHCSFCRRLRPDEDVIAGVECPYCRAAIADLEARRVPA